MTYFNTARASARGWRRYFPVFWMVSGHAMTVFGSIAGDVQLFLWPRLLLEAEVAAERRRRGARAAAPQASRRARARTATRRLSLG